MHIYVWSIVCRISLALNTDILLVFPSSVAIVVASSSWIFLLACLFFTFECSLQTNTLFLRFDGFFSTSRLFATVLFILRGMYMCVCVCVVCPNVFGVTGRNNIVIESKLIIRCIRMWTTNSHQIKIQGKESLNPHSHRCAFCLVLNISSYGSMHLLCDHSILHFIFPCLLFKYIRFVFRCGCKILAALV